MVGGEVWGSNFRPKTGVALLVAVMAALLGIAGQLIHVQKIDGPRLIAHAERQRASETVLPARRGMILDARGRVAASSESSPDVFVDPGKIDDLEALTQQLAPRLNTSPQRLAARISGRADSRYVVVATEVDEVTADAIGTLKLRGVGLSERTTRAYPLGVSLGHLVGYVGRDGVGLEGIELGFNAHLRGKDGMRGLVRDARRRALRPAESGFVPPTDGGHVVLTIDAELQRILERALAEHAGPVRAESAVGIVMSPRSGDVLAMACWPPFDPSEASTTPAQRRRNRAITDPVEPGSTFKPVIACGALQGKFVSPTESIFCHNGSHRFGSREITDTKPHGSLDLKGIIAKSSNIGMGLMAARMGNPALYDIVTRFGFGSATGIELPGESGGVVRPLRKWGSMSTQSVAMGYEINVTPLQLATAFCTMVNDGVMLRPRIVKQLLSADGSVVEDSLAQTERRVIPADVAAMRDELLTAVVEEGGGEGEVRAISRAGQDGYREAAGEEPPNVRGRRLSFDVRRLCAGESSGTCGAGDDSPA